MKAYRFVTDCIHSTFEDISALKETGKPVSYDTVARNCEGLTEWARSAGYGRDFPLKRDWHVGYYKGVYRGVPCYYVVWSGIEHIWTLGGEVGPSRASR